LWLAETDEPRLRHPIGDAGVDRLADLRWLEADPPPKLGEPRAEPDLAEILRAELRQIERGCSQR
jgi:hypothetical protein